MFVLFQCVRCSPVRMTFLGHFVDAKAPECLALTAIVYSLIY